MSMKCKKVLAVSVIFSLFMANIAYAANPKVEIAYRGSVEDGLEIKYDDGTVKYADDNVMLMMINGDLISNANIIIKNGTTLVPLRIISEQLKADVAWNAKTKTITIVKGNNTIEMKVGNKSAKLNNKSFKMNVAPQIINGYTYVPIRAVAECFNADVGYVTEIRPKVRIVWVQDRSKTVKVSKSEAIKKATDLYFNDFLPEIRDYVLEYWHIDVNNITPSNIGEKSYFKYSGKCLADLGEYYYVEVLENAVGVLVDKYNGACYPVGGYSLGYLSISDDYGDTQWGIQWQ